MRRILPRVLARRGVVVIPAFAVGRARLLLHTLAQLREDGAIPCVTIYLNSPMAARVTRLYREFPDDHVLTPEALATMHSLTTTLSSVEQSKALNRRSGPMIIVSASGMATGGRVLHHHGLDLQEALAFAGDGRARATVAAVRLDEINGLFDKVRAPSRAGSSRHPAPTPFMHRAHAGPSHGRASWRQGRVGRTTRCTNASTRPQATHRAQAVQIEGDRNGGRPRRG